MLIDAYKVLALRAEDVYEHLIGEFTIKCSDGEIKTNARHTYISAFTWEIIKHFPKIPLCKKHILTHYLPLDGTFKSSTHMSIVSTLVDDFYEYYPNYTHQEKHTLLRLMYLITNRLYNDLVKKGAKWYGTMDILDIVDILYDPKVLELKEKGEYTQAGVKAIQSSIIGLITNEARFKKNNVSRLLAAGLIKTGQLAQSVGPWGYPMDVDSFPFAKPIKRGYAEGIRNFYEHLTESRTAAMALHYTETPLKRTEYFSRKTQLVGGQLEHVHPGDCGSRDYHYRVIRNQKELDNMEGIYYWDKDLNTLNSIDPKKDKHLVGKLVAMRSVWNCHHPDPNGICATCLGKISRNLIDGTNIGMQAAVEMNSPLSQLVLSTKHEIGSGEAAGIVLKGHIANYFKVTEQGMGYALADHLKGKHVRLILPSVGMSNFVDALMAKDLRDISPDRVTEFKEIRVVVYNEETKKETNEKVDLEFQSRKASMTRNLLAYMKDKSHWYLDKRSNYEIDLSDWNFDDTLFKIPPKQFSTVAFSRTIENLLESRVNESKKRDNETTLGEYFEELMETVFMKMPFHLSILQVVAYTSMITSAKEGDGALPKPWSDSGVGVLKQTMQFRSLSTVLAFQNHDEFLTKPGSFLNTNRPDHPFDWFILPQEVKHHKQPTILKESPI